MSRIQRRRAASVEGEEVQNPQPEHPRETAAEASPLFGVAMLKIAMELKKPHAPALDDILTGVLRTMNLSESEFRAYLESNGGLLRTIAQKRKY